MISLGTHKPQLPSHFDLYYFCYRWCVLAVMFFNILFLAGIVQPPANSNASPAHSASAERSPTGSASPAHRPPSNEKTVDNW